MKIMDIIFDPKLIDTFLNTKLWIVSLLILDLLLVLLFLVLIRRTTKVSNTSPNVDQLNEIIKPFLDEAQEIAAKFQVQLQEKQLIVKNINEKLDSRIISLNLLLNRAETYIDAQNNKGFNANPGHQKPVYELQEEVIELSSKGIPPAIIAEQIGIPKGEVNLVLELKRKFLDMEKNYNSKIEEGPKTELKENEIKIPDYQKKPKKDSIVNKVGKNDIGLVSEKNKTPEKITLQTKINKKTSNENRLVNLETDHIQDTYTPSSSKKQTSEPLDTEEIIGLAKKGLDSNVIAKRMGASPGEVDLILDLKRKFQKIQKAQS